MKTSKRRQWAFTLGLAAAVVLMIAGTLMLVHTITAYNRLSLQRQDSQLQDMAHAADRYIAIQMDTFRESLTNVLERRGFSTAEQQWLDNSDPANLMTRMQEHLLARSDMFHAILAIKDGQILLSTSESIDYIFPQAKTGPTQICFSPDGTMYLALIESTARADYALLIDAVKWYDDLSFSSGIDSSWLLLLGRHGRILLHRWQGSTRVHVVDELTADNCDLQAVNHMISIRSASGAQSISYRLTLPGETRAHDMRMTAIPARGSSNGYFIVGFTSNYDEIIEPMHAAILRLVVCGGCAIAGVLMLILLLLLYLHQHDRELQRLRARNAETQRLLDTTRELAHHQRLEIVGTLASSIAHEFNNLLTPIMGYAILTLEALPESAPELADNIAEIYEASRKAKTIIARLSELSRKNSDSHFKPVDLESLCRRALDVAAPAQSRQVTTALQCEAPCTLSGDETQLYQMLLNLILNAFHAMAAQGGTLRITIRQEDGSAVLEVADTGTGIPEDALPHIFEPFYTTRSPGQGTGLGLAIVHQVVENHGGSIHVDSTPGRGCLFTLRFPLADSSETPIS